MTTMASGSQQDSNSWYTRPTPLEPRILWGFSKDILDIEITEKEREQAAIRLTLQYGSVQRAVWQWTDHANVDNKYTNAEVRLMYDFMAEQYEKQL